MDHHPRAFTSSPVSQSKASLRLTSLSHDPHPERTPKCAQQLYKQVPAAGLSETTTFLLRALVCDKTCPVLEHPIGGPEPVAWHIEKALTDCQSFIYKKGKLRSSEKKALKATRWVEKPNSSQAFSAPYHTAWRVSPLSMLNSRLQRWVDDNSEICSSTSYMRLFKYQLIKQN